MTDKTVLITGSASGIGKAIAYKLHQQGYRLVLVDQDACQLVEVAEQVGAQALSVDLANSEACQQLLNYVQGEIDILVNCAGFQYTAPLEEFDPAQWDKMLKVMLTAPFLLAQACWPHMQAQGWGRVINIAGIDGLVASPYKAADVAAKHGLVGLTKAMALEGGERGITVNAICPSYVRTPLLEAQLSAQAQQHDLSEQQVLEQILLEPSAMKRLIEPEEVAELTAYLISDNARSVTGASLTIDQGWTSR